MSAQNSDMEQFSGLVRAHQAGLRAFVCSLGVYPDAVDDVAQEVFLVAWRSRGRLQPESDYTSWLRGIARNVVSNERRKASRRTRLFSAHLSEILESTMGEEEVVELDRLPDLLEIMRHCLKLLPERSQVLLTQRYENEEKAVALGGRMGMGADAVRHTLLRIRRNLLECVEGKAGAQPS
jgi:RNA polymerase sigma-70 factor (ECF subfamily)